MTGERPLKSERSKGHVLEAIKANALCHHAAKNRLANGFSFPDGDLSHFPDSSSQCLTMLTVKMFFLMSYRMVAIPANFSISCAEGWTTGDGFLPDSGLCDSRKRYIFGASTGNWGTLGATYQGCFKTEYNSKVSTAMPGTQ